MTTSRPLPYVLIVFISNACIMVIELVAGRLLAPNIGSSLYTWTSIVGVIFAGMSAGNLIGGRIADRRASPRLLGWMFALAALGALSTLGIAALAGGQPLALLPGLGLLGSMLAFVAGVFLLPGALLGAISPVVIRLSLNDLTTNGRAVGRIYAASAAGSILGTFLTGYVLLSYAGVHMILAGVAATLLLLALALLAFAPRQSPTPATP